MFFFIVTEKCVQRSSAAVSLYFAFQVY